MSTEWVFNRLGSVKILDTTRHITPKKNAKTEFMTVFLFIVTYIQKRLPNAQYLDLLQLCTAQGPLLKTLPTEAQFKEAMETLGISDTDDIVLYDSQGLYSSARVWFMFQVFNRNARVHIMNGGITRWETEKYPIETGPAKTCEKRGSFNIDENFNIVCSLADVKQRVKDYENGITKRSVVDMRRDCCFHGTCRVPIAGIPKGHIPGAVNVPFHYLTDPYNNYMIRNPTELRAIFEKHGVIIGEPEKMIFRWAAGRRGEA